MIKHSPLVSFSGKFIYLIKTSSFTLLFHFSEFFSLVTPVTLYSIFVFTEENPLRHKQLFYVIHLNVYI